MAKYILTIPLLSVALFASSCSQEEIGSGRTNKTDRSIEFMTSLPGLSSRATEINTSSLNEFKVSSFVEREDALSQHFFDKTYIRNAETNLYFSNDPKCIWPNNNDKLRFFAYSHASENISTVDGSQVNVKISPDIASQVDYVTAIGRGNLWDNEDTPITLQFQHQLSRIMLKAWGNSQSFDIEIAGVRLGGIGKQGTFTFNQDMPLEEPATIGTWASISHGEVEYIYRAGDTLVTINNTDQSPSTSDKAVSILGKKVGSSGYDNSAMLIPSHFDNWDYKNNAANGLENTEGLYFAVLMRVTDATSYNPGNLIYPYSDNEEGIEVIYIAVDKADGKSVKTRVYPNEDGYFSDEISNEIYDPEANNAEIKAFSWAALPVAVDWEAGLEYTYTLNYTNGVGLRIPTDPQPGTPILSDRVLMDLEVSAWKQGKDSEVTVPRK